MDTDELLPNEQWVGARLRFVCSLQTHALDRVSNSGNPIATETHNDKSIHVPGRRPGDRLLVRLDDAGGYYEATVVDRYETAVTPRTSTPSTANSTDTDETTDLLQLGRNSAATRHSPSNSVTRRVRWRRKSIPVGKSGRR